MVRIEDIVEMSTKKRRGSKDDEEDRISNLPDSILLHILSFLPMKDVVKTILLRRFGNLWASVHTLDFDGRSYLNFSKDCNNKWFTDFVLHVLFRHECPTIFKFSLKFGSYLYFSPNDVKPREHRKPLEPKFANNIDSWIYFAVRKKVKVLDLGILAHGSSSARFDYDLPDVVFTSDSIDELKLVNIGLRQQEQVHMKSLQTLSLTTIMLNDKMIEGILSGCPLLESLSLIQCWGFHKLNCISAKLTKLMIVLGEFELARLKISGPNLVSLNISGLKGHVDLRNLSSLLEATLDLCFGGTCPVGGTYCNVGSLLEGLHHANTFTISNWCILVLTLWELKNIHCPSSTRNCLVLKTMVTKWHLPGIASLLRNSPNLEMLTIHIEEGAWVVPPADDLRVGISRIHEDNYWNDETWLKSFDFNEERYFDSQPFFSCLRNHLKTVKIRGCLSNPSLLLLVKYLLRYSAVLERMEIYMKQSYPSQSSSAELLEFSRKLSTCRKASASAMIVYSC